MRYRQADLRSIVDSINDWSGIRCEILYIELSVMNVFLDILLAFCSVTVVRGISS